MRASLGALLLLVGCGPGAVGPTYRGEPLFTVSGQLVTSGPAPTTPIRLAVAWYPDEQTSTAPKSIVTQDVEYQGSFPLNYAFSFFTVPEAGALHEYLDRDQVVRAAFGVLLAYEDGNGNGKLDPITKGGARVDRVLGSSVGDTYNGAPAPRPIWVAFVEGTPPPTWVGYGPGYNLSQGGQIVAASTSVPIALTGSNELNFFVCEEFISGSSYGYDLPCDLAPTGGVRVIGNLYRQNGVAGASLRVTDGTNVLPNVLVEVNDAGVGFDAQNGLYLAAGTVPLATPGLNVVKVTAPGKAPLVFELEAPDDFALQAPPDGTRLLTGTPLTVQWTRATGAAFYQVQGYALTPPNPGPPPVLVAAARPLTATLPGFGTDDTVQLVVSAFAGNYLAHGRGASLVNVSTSRSTYLDVHAADGGLWLEGGAFVSTYRGLSNGATWVQGFDGVTPVSDALVTANGTALPFDRTNQQYGGVVDLQPADTALLAISRVGTARSEFPVILPDDFTVTALPASHQADQPLVVSWSPAPGAMEYRLYVSDATGRQLHFEALLGTQATLPPLQAVGDVAVTINAVRYASDRHLIGMIQKSFDLTLTR